MHLETPSAKFWPSRRGRNALSNAMTPKWGQNISSRVLELEFMDACQGDNGSDNDDKRCLG